MSQVNFLFFNASTTGEPLWSAIPRALGPAITAIVAVVLAVAGYFKFVKGRTFQPRLALDLKASPIRLRGTPALYVEVLIKNEGHSGVVLDPCYSQCLDVFIADDPVWADAVSSDDGVILWHDGTAPHRQLDVLLDPGVITHDVWPYRDAQKGDRDLAEQVHGHKDSDRDRRPIVDGWILEPGEQERRALLVPVQDAAAYLLQLSVHACRHASRVSRVAHNRCVQQRRHPDLWQLRSIVYTTGQGTGNG